MSAETPPAVAGAAASPTGADRMPPSRGRLLAEHLHWQAGNDPAYVRASGEGAADGILAVATEWFSRHGGLSTFNREICRALARAGQAVACLVLTATSEEITDAARHGVMLVEAAGNPEAGDKYRLARRPQLPAGFRPAFVVGHGRVTGDAALSQASEHFIGARRLHFAHVIPDELEFERRQDRGVDPGAVAESRTKWELELCRTAHRVFTVGPRIQDRFVTYLEPRGVSPVQVDPGFDRTGQLASAAPGGEPLKVLISGRVEDEEIKGVDIGAAAVGFAEHRRLIHDKSLEIVVRGAEPGTSRDLRKKIRKWADSPDLNVVVRPFSVDAVDLSADLAEASLVLMPSRREGFGLAGAEAILARRPLLVSENSGLAKLLREVLGVQEARRYVVEMSGGAGAVARRWGEAVRESLHDPAGSFQAANALATRMAETRTWDMAARTIINHL